MIRYVFFLVIALLSGNALANSTDKELLDRAYLDELNAKTRYETLVNQFGDMRPFVMLREAEERHLQLLKAAYRARSLSLPDIVLPKPATFSSIDEACNVSITAERANVAMYEDLIAASKDPKLMETFITLQSASRDRHIPALLRCQQGCQNGYRRNNDRPNRPCWRND